jgi:hypothetical protein
MSAVGEKSGSKVPEPAAFIVNVAADISVHHDNGFGLELAVEGRQHRGVGNRVLGGRSTKGSEVYALQIDQAGTASRPTHSELRSAARPVNP